MIKCLQESLSNFSEVRKRATALKKAQALSERAKGLSNSSLRAARKSIILKEKMLEIYDKLRAKGKMPESNEFWLLFTGNKSQKMMAMDALSRLRTEETLPIFQNFLKNPDPDIRFEAISSLGNFALKKAISWIKLRLKDSDPKVRQRASDTIRELELVGE